MAAVANQTTRGRPTANATVRKVENRESATFCAGRYCLHRNPQRQRGDCASGPAGSPDTQALGNSTN